VVLCYATNTNALTKDAKICYTCIMKALSLTHQEATREKLLALAKQMPGAWFGIKIAALLLVLEGQRPGWVNALLGLNRMTLERWINGVNREGIQALIPEPRTGRPTQLTPAVRQQLERDLENPPRELGLNRAAWDGPTLVVHLKKHFGLNLRVRQAQYWLHRLDYSLKQAGYVYLQARAKDARHFRRELKKTVPPSIQ
jgi:transposase